MNQHSYAHVRGAPPREREDWLPPGFVFDFYTRWADLNQQIQDLQDTKKAMLGNVRSHFGRHQAESLRVTMNLALMDPRKRAEVLTFNEMAHHYMDLLETEIEARSSPL